MKTNQIGVPYLYQYRANLVSTYYHLKFPEDLADGNEDGVPNFPKWGSPELMNLIIDHLLEEPRRYTPTMVQAAILIYHGAEKQPEKLFDITDKSLDIWTKDQFLSPSEHFAIGTEGWADPDKFEL